MLNRALPEPATVAGPLAHGGPRPLALPEAATCRAPVAANAALAHPVAAPLSMSLARQWPALVLVAVAGLLVMAPWLADQWARSSPPGETTHLAAAHRFELANRLRLADRVLRSVAADVASRGSAAVALGATEKRYFESVSYVQAGVAPLPLLGAVALAPHLRDAMADQLAQGESVLVAAPEAAGRIARTLLVRSLARSGSTDALLVAEVAPQYLWQVDRSGTPGTEYCVRDATGQPLQCSSPRALQALGALGRQPLQAPGQFRWQAGAETWNGAAVDLDLAAPATDGNWTVLSIASPAGASALVSGIGAALPAAAALAALGAGALLRRRRPAQLQLAPGADTPAQAPDAHGTPARPVGAPDRMAEMLERQKRVIQAMADIDRASLSRVNADRLTELAAGHMLACTGCDTLLIGVLDRDVASSMRVVLTSRDGATPAAEQAEVGPSAVQLLAVPPDGAWVCEVREYALLEAQAKRGVNGALLLPIYEDGKPIGIISIGFDGQHQIGSDESGNARALAGRLGAALTSAARAQALYAYTHFDATTALPNRQYLKEHLAQQIRQARRDRGRLALLFVDLDGFKKVNASLGHGRADLVLAEAASRMRACVREEDVVTRFGGDEFVVVLPRITEGMDARRVADKLLEAVARPYLAGGDEHHLGCSIGISVYPDDAQTVDRMLRNADSAMFNAKEAGRGRYLFFDAAVNRAAAARTELERDLRRALANAEFTVAYQPQIDLRDGRITGAEALVRWCHPTRGMVSPAEFIAVAEGAGLIAQIDEFVLRTACTQFRQWDAQGIAPQRMAVNISGLEIARTDIVARVESVLQDTGLRPLHIELELTEGVFLDHSNESLDKLRQLQQRGVRIAMDDFGTGYSSLSYLQRLPIDVVKIDQSFVRELGANADSGSIVRAILEVAHSLGKSVVAEGIETEQQRALLAGWGCDVGQGYLWSKPLGAAAFGDFCRVWQQSGQAATLAQ